MLHTTFRKLHKEGACAPSYLKLGKTLGGIRKYGKDTPIPLDKVLESNGLDDALWCLQCINESADREIYLLTCDYARRESPMSRDWAWANWDATWAAWIAAWDARDAAGATGDAARAAEREWQTQRFIKLLQECG